MGSYFKPLRRKLGVLTLLMALLFMVAWVRSLAVVDWINLPLRNESGRNTLSQIASGDGRIEIYWFSEMREVPGPAPPPPAATPSMGVNVDLSAVAGMIQEKILEFTENVTTMLVPGVSITKNVEVTPTLAISYWSIVIPLTLLSAWLLLSRPRIVKPTA